MNTVLFSAVLANLAEVAPSSSAIITPDVCLDRATLTRRVFALADWLLDQGLRPGLPTGVMLPDEIEHILASLALICLGCPSFVLASFQSPKTLVALAERIGAVQMVARTGGPAIPKLAVFQPPFEELASDSGSSAISGRLQNYGFAEPKPLYFRTTSGTTGVPKVFSVSLTMSLSQITRMAQAPNEACVLRASPVEFDSTRLYRLNSLFAGRCAAIMENVSLANLSDFCRMAGVTEIHAGTYRLATLLSAAPGPAERLPAGIRLLSGASRVSGALREAVQSRLTNDFWISYATGETSIISVAAPHEHPIWPEGIGHPALGVEVSLRGADGTDVPRGETGVAWVRKAGVNCDADGQAQWTNTGDLLSWPEGGPLIFHGRADEMMIMNGINIFPNAIEDFLDGHPDVRESVAYGVASAIHGQIPVADVVLHEGLLTTEAELLAHARAHLGLGAPRRIRIVPQIPRTPTGKPKRNLLSKQA